jgi:hypothetical protein
LLAVAGRCSASTLRIVLDRAGELTKQVLTDMTYSAATNHVYGPSVMKQLLGRVEKMDFTEDVLMAAVLNGTAANELMKMFLDEDPEIELTEEVLEAAIWRLEPDETLLSLLERVRAIGIKARFLEAAAINTHFGDELLKLLMEIGKVVEIPKKLVKCAAANCGTGAEVMQLLERQFGKVEISDEFMATAASQGCPGTMMFLLERVDNAIIMEEILIKAIENLNFCIEKQAIRLLIGKATNIPITDDILRSAARNLIYKDTLALLWS